MCNKDKSSHIILSSNTEGKIWHQTESDPSFGGYPAGACELQSWAGDTDPSGSPISFE